MSHVNLAREPLTVVDKPQLPQSLSPQLLAPLFESDVIFSKRISQSNLFGINFVNSSVILCPMDLRVKHVPGIPISA